MIVQERISDTLVKTYSDRGVMIHGGYPEADYTEAVDPISAGRTYTETNIPIPPPEVPDGIEDAARYLLDQKLVELPETEQADYFNESEPDPNYFEEANV